MKLNEERILHSTLGYSSTRWKQELEEVPSLARFGASYMGQSCGRNKS